MRILSITAQKPHSTGSGVYLTELVKGFAKLGHEQAVIAGMYREDLAEFPAGVDFFPVYFRSEALPFAVTGMSDEMPYESTRYRDMTEEMSLKFRRAFSECILQAAGQFRPELIICHHLYALAELARELCPDITVIGICHGSDLRQIKTNGWRQREIAAGVKKLDAVFALHDVQREEIVRLFGLPGDKVHVIGTGYNNDIFCTEPKTSGEQARTKGSILFAGKLSEKKGVKSLIRALKLVGHPQYLKLTLAGGCGNETEWREIESLSRECPVRTVFTGRVSQEELARMMRAHEIFVLSSFYEGLPLVVIEALACGAKVVCTDLPGIKAWMNGHVPGHGVVFVEPPEMKGEDEPLSQALPAFEGRLARAVEEALEEPDVNPEGLAEISWEGICRRILKKCRETVSIF